MNSPSVKIGEWYLDRDKHDLMCVIGIEEEEGVVGIRDSYGDVDEIAFDEWESMDLIICATPREWGGLLEEDADGIEDMEAGVGPAAD